MLEVFSGIIFDIRKYSIHDGPGIRTTVFFKGCPLRCAWCHNPESQSFDPELILRPNRCIVCSACVDACSNNAIRLEGGQIITDRSRCELNGECVSACYAEARQLTGHEMSVAEVMAEIERDLTFYDQSGGGVTFSGGEPLAQHGFLLSLLKACKARGLHVTLDTCGFAAWPVLDEVRAYVDVFLYDLKMVDDDRHHAYTGVPVAPILKNLELLAEHGSTVVIRMPIIPGVNDDLHSLKQAGEFLSSLPQHYPVELLPYHEIGLAKYTGLGMEYALSEIQSPQPEKMQEWAQVLREYGLQVKN